MHIILPTSTRSPYHTHIYKSQCAMHTTIIVKPPTWRWNIFLHFCTYGIHETIFLLFMLSCTRKPHKRGDSDAGILWSFHSFRGSCILNEQNKIIHAHKYLAIKKYHHHRHHTRDLIFVNKSPNSSAASSLQTQQQSKKRPFKKCVHYVELFNEKLFWDNEEFLRLLTF